MVHDVMDHVVVVDVVHVMVMAARIAMVDRGRGRRHGIRLLGNRRRGRRRDHRSGSGLRRTGACAKQRQHAGNHKRPMVNHGVLPSLNGWID